LAKVEVAAVCTQAQPSEFWSTVMARLLLEQEAGVEITRIQAVRSALPDYGKNTEVGAMAPVHQKNRNSKTDANRNRVIGGKVNGELLENGFLASDSEWLFFMDDDTVMPRLAISKLLSLGREFAAGVYFTDGPNTIPLMYKRDTNGLYHALDNYAKGAVIQVDAVGMGCALIHRSVFEKIMEAHTVLQRPNGALFPVHNSKIKGKIPVREKMDEPFVRNGVYHAQVSVPMGNQRGWPFYLMEFGRTEDLHFCELAASVGIKPYVDTTIVCDHLKLGPINEERFKKYRKEALRGIGS